MQQIAVPNGCGAAAQSAQAARGGARPAAGAANAGAGPMAGFAALLTALGQDEEGAGLLPGGALGAGADEPAPGFSAGTGLLPQAAEPETAEPTEPASGVPQDLAMLLAGLGQPAAPAWAGEQEQAQTLSVSASSPWQQQLAQPGPEASSAAPGQAQLLSPPDGEPGREGADINAGQLLPVGQSGNGHWVNTGLVAETSRLDSSRQGLAPEQLDADAPRPGPARGVRASLAAGRAQLGGADAAPRLMGRGVQTGLVAASGSAQGHAPTQATTGELAAAVPRSLASPERSAELSARQGLAGGAVEAALSGAALQPAATGGQRPGGGDAQQPGGQAFGGSASVAGAGEPDLGSPGAGVDAAWQADLEAAQAELAENVTYWVHQQTQNAALTLEGDGQAVQVQVALTGDQAHITFRSDEEQARQLLDAGTQELRELLDARGLQLAGVTIGSASSDGAGGNSRQPGQAAAHGARQGVVRAPGGAAGGAGADAGTGPVPGRRAGGISARSVDIFV